MNLAGCADWQTGNSDPALLILLTFNITSRIKNEMIPAIIPMNIFGKYVNVYVKVNSEYNIGETVKCGEVKTCTSLTSRGARVTCYNFISSAQLYEVCTS